MKIPIKEYLNLLWRYIRPLWFQTVILGLMIIVNIVLQLINPQIIRFFIDTVTKSDSSDKLIYAAGLFIGIALVQQVINIAATYMSQNIGWISTNELRTDLVKHCLNLDMSFHKEHQPGELIQRVDGDVTALFNFFSKFSLELLTNIGLIIGVLVLFFQIDWRIGITLTIFCTLAFFIFSKIQNIAIPYKMKEREINTKFFGFLGEQITCTEDIRSNGAVSNVMYNFYKIIREWLPAKMKSTMISYTTWMTAEAVSAIGNFASLGFGFYLFKKGSISLGVVYVIFKYIDLLIRPLEQIRRQLDDLQNASTSIIRIKEVLNIESKIKDESKESVSNGAVSVKVEDIYFDYEEGIPVLEGIKFNIREGKILGVLGRTGSGKTTLARLIVRFYDPQKGCIKLSNKAINEVALKDLRKSIAYVTQEVQLFKGTVRDNLTFFNKNIRDDVILKAINDIGLTEWLNSLSNGLDTLLDADGAGLSAGEAQLLAFVRAFLKNPGIVILDEASSRLDPVTEQLIEKAVNKLLKGRTAIIIAHRLKTIQRADDILILDNGKIYEYGNREELSKNSQSHFYHLLQTGIEEVLA